MTNDLLTGYGGALVAVFFFGTCYVPAKSYPTYDGIIFQWFMCSGILMVGIVWGLLSNNWSEYAEAGLYTFREGILGGSFFAIANLLIPTVVNNLGLGVGFMLWNATNITIGCLISRFGLFGVVPTIPAHPILSALGIIFMLASIGVYGMIKPTLSPKTPGNRYMTPQSNEFLPLLRTTNNLNREKESLPQVLIHPELPNFGPFTIPADVTKHIELVDQKVEKQRKVIGVVIALLVGAFLGCCLVPYVHWQQNCHPTIIGVEPRQMVGKSCNPLNFVFSQCLGIYLTSTIAFLLYSLFHRFILRRSMPRSVMRPAYMCGVLWAIGLMGQFYSMGKLGFDQAFPLSSIGPAMVSMLWSALYFQEIQGNQNQFLLILATSMVGLGIGLRVLSQ